MHFIGSAFYCWRCCKRLEETPWTAQWEQKICPGKACFCVQQIQCCADELEWKLSRVLEEALADESSRLQCSLDPIHHNKRVTRKAFTGCLECKDRARQKVLLCCKKVLDFGVLSLYKLASSTKRSAQSLPAWLECDKVSGKASWHDWWEQKKKYVTCVERWKSKNDELENGTNWQLEALLTEEDSHLQSALNRLQVALEVEGRTSQCTWRGNKESKSWTNCKAVVFSQGSGGVFMHRKAAWADCWKGDLLWVVWAKQASKPISGGVPLCFSFLNSEDEVALKESVLDKAVTYNALPNKKMVMTMEKSTSSEREKEMTVSFLCRFLESETTCIHCEGEGRTPRKRKWVEWGSWAHHTKVLRVLCLEKVSW